MMKIETQVDEDVKTRFKTIAKSKGFSEARFLRYMILKEIDLVKYDENKPLEPDIEKLSSVRVYVRVPEFILRDVKRRAKLKGMTSSRWIAALIQSNIMRLPVSSEKELFELESSNRQLAAIGRNINQIAKTLNEAFHRTEAVKIDMLEALTGEIKKNREIIISLVRACQNVWRVEE